MGRGVAEYWVLDYGLPASYRHPWGGPSLLGVFLVYGGRGAAIVIAAGIWWRRRRTRAPARQPDR